MVNPVPSSLNFQAAADKAVLGVCELLGLLFGLPFGEDLYRDRPFGEIPMWHWLYLAIGICFAGGGFMFPWMRTRTWIPEIVSTSLSKAVLDARYWIAALLTIFIYMIGPEIYRRTAEPRASFPTTDEIAAAVVHKLPKANTPTPAMIAPPATPTSFVSPIHEKSSKWDIVQGVRIAILRNGLNPECHITIVRESDGYAKDYDADFREILDVLNWSVKDGDERIGPVEKEMTIRAINYGPSKDCAEALAVRIRNVGRTRKGSSLNSLIQLFDETSAPSYIKQCVSACIEVDFGLEDTTR